MLTLNKLIAFLILIMTLSFLVLLYNRYYRSRNAPKKNSYRFKDWLEMSKEERRNIDLEEKERTLERKKLLLKVIRKEYKSLKRNNNFK